MESAHLTTAHEHVRNAQTATLGSSIALAGDEHDHAAAFFHNASEDTHNAEALRILALLEDHHRKLAGLIKEAPRKPDTKPGKKTDKSDKTASSTPSLPDTSTSTSATTSPRTHRRLPQPSIASNLAEKRGIPSARRTTSGNVVTVSGAIAPRDGHATPVRDLLERQSRKSDQARSRELKPPQPPPPSSPPSEESFRRFYSAFSGVISAISAPLAFTSLPLNPVSPTPAPEPPRVKPTSSKSRTSSPEASRTVKSSVPDLAALISKPALRALRSDSTHPLNPNESFYLVPPSGGTVTYASMLQNSNTQPHLPAIDEASNSLKGSLDEFVDAQESVAPPSPTTARRPASHTTPHSIPAGRGTGLKTHEELALENETLKLLVDKQAKRIQMWETNSQNQFNALAQSFRARPLSATSTTTTSSRPKSPPELNALAAPSSPAATTTPSTAADTTADTTRISLLEAQLASLSSQNAQLARQSERDRLVIARYREQWEKLKAGARRKETERRRVGGIDVKEGDEEVEG